MVSLLAVLFVGVVFLIWRLRDQSQFRPARLEILFTLAVGLVLTLFTAFFVILNSCAIVLIYLNNWQIPHSSLLTFINVGKRDLESLGRYSENNEVTVGEFERFVEYLFIDPYVIA